MESAKNTPHRYFSRTAKITICLVLLMLITSTTVFTIYKLKKDIKVMINNDGNKEEINITSYSYKKDLKSILEENGVKLKEKDKVDLNLSKYAEKGDIINIKRAVKVTINVGDKKSEVLTSDDSIKELLSNQNININSLDKVSPGINESIRNGLTVNVVKVEKEIVKHIEKIYFEEIEEEDDTLYEGDEEIKQEGVQGEKEISTEIIYENGNVKSEEIIGSETIKEAKDKIVLIGTKKKPEPVNMANVAFDTADYAIPANLSFKDVISFDATAYYDAGGTGSTASGAKPIRDPGGWSTIAADTSILPMGTKVYVEGYGYAIVQDTGGAIKGNILDLYFNTHEDCVRYGRKSGVKVYVLN